MTRTVPQITSAIAKAEHKIRRILPYAGNCLFTSPFLGNYHFYYFLDSKETVNRIERGKVNDL